MYIYTLYLFSRFVREYFIHPKLVHHGIVVSDVGGFIFWPPCTFQDRFSRVFSCRWVCGGRAVPVLFSCSLRRCHRCCSVYLSDSEGVAVGAGWVHSLAGSNDFWAALTPSSAGHVVTPVAQA